MRSPIALLLLASACGFPGAEGQAPDSAMMVPDAPKCEPTFVNLCEQTARNEDFIVGTTEINTTDDTRCVPVQQAGGPELCLLYYNKVEVQQGGVLTVFGTRPFALVAKDTMRIRGRIDAASKGIRPSSPGPGGGPATTTGLCGFDSAPEAANCGGAGGAGGTFSTQGGNGGLGNTDGSDGAGTGNRAGGIPGPVITLPTFLRGGCDGQAGAPGDPPVGASGGRGGGAVYLSAASLQITGEVVAGGAGGAATMGNDDGGAGGGSGGMIVAQAASLSVNGMLLATGGGGGKGANQNNGAGGSDATTPNAAPGGMQGPGGGPGGAGATSAMGVDGMGSVGGGGGGGGGAGFILLLGESIDITNAVIVPTAIQRKK